MCNKSMLITKFCAKCQKRKSVKHFHKNARTPTKLQSYCKKCHRLTMITWNKNHPDKLMAMSLKYRLHHRTEIRVRNRTWRAVHKDRINAANRIMYHKTLDHQRALRRTWYHRNLDKARKMSRDGHRKQYRAHWQESLVKQRARRGKNVEHRRMIDRRQYYKDTAKKCARSRIYRARQKAGLLEVKPLQKHDIHYKDRVRAAQDDKCAICHIALNNKGGWDTQFDPNGGWLCVPCNPARFIRAEQRFLNQEGVLTK